MKRERLEELVVQVTWALTRGADSGHVQAVRAALLAVERETVERCAHRAEIWDSEPLSGKSIAEEVRSLLTEE